MTTVMTEMLQSAANAAEKANAQTVAQPTPQAAVAPVDAAPEKVAPISQPVAQPEQASDPRQSQEYIDYSSKKDTALRALYAYRIKHNIEFTPAFQAILTDRFPTYNPEQKKFTGRGGRRKKTTESAVKPVIKPVATKTKKPGKKARVINWDEKPDAILWKAYEHRKNTGIDDSLHAVLTKRFPDEYDPVARKRIKKVKLHDFATKKPKESDAARIASSRHAATLAKKATPTAKPTQLSVTLKLVKQSLNDAYYNVYVNGERILSNHANTEVKLFADGTLLGIHGIVTNDKRLPQRPLWLIYDTNLVQKQFPGRDPITKYNIYATDVADTQTGVRITLSANNNLMKLLETEKLKRQAGLTRFKIER